MEVNKGGLAEAKKPHLVVLAVFDELRAQYPGRWHRGQLMAFRNRVRLWREDARARGIDVRALAVPTVIQTSQELLAAFKFRYPDRYHAGLYVPLNADSRSGDTKPYND